MDVGVGLDIFPGTAISVVGFWSNRVRCVGKLLAAGTRTSKKLSPALWISIRMSSEPGFKAGSGALWVSCILDG
jgi:hypothetical protein